jgi:hypothetical protein
MKGESARRMLLSHPPRRPVDDRAAVRQAVIWLALGLGLLACALALVLAA